MRLYALVADPFDLRAVRQFITQGQGKPARAALFVRDALMVEELAREVTARFQILARRFWPGPLTIILPASATLPLRATGNTGRSPCASRGPPHR